MIYTHVLKVAGHGVISPLDRMEHGDNVAEMLIDLCRSRY